MTHGDHVQQRDNDEIDDQAANDLENRSTVLYLGKMLLSLFFFAEMHVSPRTTAKVDRRQENCG